VLRGFNRYALRLGNLAHALCVLRLSERPSPNGSVGEAPAARPVIRNRGRMAGSSGKDPPARRDPKSRASSRTR
jgi:hypothetical protein